MRRLLAVTALGFLAACARADAAPQSSRPEATSDASQAPQLPTIVVYKSPTCGCCEGWVQHMREAGFSVDARDVGDAQLVDVKTQAGVPPQLQTCHTALVDGYVIEGHVPAEQIKRLLADRPPDVVGIAVPGMPMGAPGMEGPGAEPYKVYSWKRDGSGAVFAEIDPR
jgi:hypothetical protein